MKNNRKGFTLAELLIVVAIIAVLVAVAIPVFTSQLEKSRESTDAANIRSAYAAVQTAALTQANDVAGVTRDGTTAGSYTYTATVEAVQTVADWQNEGLEKIGDLDVTQNEVPCHVKDDGGWTITYDESKVGTDEGPIKIQ